MRGVGHTLQRTEAMPAAIGRRKAVKTRRCRAGSASGSGIHFNRWQCIEPSLQFSKSREVTFRMQLRLTRVLKTAASRKECIRGAIYTQDEPCSTALICNIRISFILSPRCNVPTGFEFRHHPFDLLAASELPNANPSDFRHADNG
jgi:hypothetical protein